jgi:hypothetical protein
VPDNRPPWLETVTVAFPSGRSATELCPVDVAHVAWAANSGCLDFHPWPTRRDHVEQPDELRIDLDPMPGTGWEEVVETALELQALFDELGFVSFPKTSGSKGVHVYLRIRPSGPSPRCGTAPWPSPASWSAAARTWPPRSGGRRSAASGSSSTTTGWPRDQTIASAYSVRARPRATVSAPVTWAELPGCEVEDFDIWTMRERFAELGDVHAAIDDVQHDLTPLLELYERQGEGEAPYPPQFPKMEGEPLRSRPVGRRPAAQKRAELDAKRRAEADADRDRTPPRNRRPPARKAP